LNNITLISKNKAIPDSNTNDKELRVAIEHRIFFNDHYKQEYDRNKIIFTKNNKRKKGLLQDVSLDTEFDKSIIYEAFDLVYL
jgi:hypothetical protein